MHKSDRATAARQEIHANILSCTQEEEHDPQFEPVIKLTEQVETKTHEEDEEVLFKMCVRILNYFGLPS